MLFRSGLYLENSATEFDEWSKINVYVAFYQPGDKNFGTLFGKSDYAGWMGNTKDIAWALFTHRLDGGFNHWGVGMINSDASANIYLNSMNKQLQGADGGGPGLLTLKWTGGAPVYVRMNGGAASSDNNASINQTVATGNISGPVESKPNKLFTIGCHNSGGGLNNMAVAEFLIFEDDLPSSKRDILEGYLAHKWNLSSVLPSDHTYKSSAPTVGGWSIERGSSDDQLSLNLDGAGGAFSSNVPMNDGEWHHLATTFGGGNKKIYVDGVEVATASQSGSVTDSVVRLVLGDYNEYGDSPDRATIDDVRFYRMTLSADEISAIYNNGNGDVGYPKFPIKIGRAHV